MPNPNIAAAQSRSVDLLSLSISSLTMASSSKEKASDSWPSLIAILSRKDNDWSAEGCEDKPGNV